MIQDPTLDAKLREARNQLREHIGDLTVISTRLIGGADVTLEEGRRAGQAVMVMIAHLFRFAEEDDVATNPPVPR